MYIPIAFNQSICAVYAVNAFQYERLIHSINNNNKLVSKK